MASWLRPTDYSGSLGVVPVSNGGGYNGNRPIYDAAQFYATLTNTSPQTLVLTGGGSFITTLPTAATFIQGQSFLFGNIQTGTTLTINTKIGGNTFIVLAAGLTATFFCTNPAGSDSSLNGTWTYTIAPGVQNSTAGVLPVAYGGTGANASTGTGAIVLNASPSLTTPALGTPSSATLTNATGLPIVAGTTGTLSIARGGTGYTSLPVPVINRYSVGSYSYVTPTGALYLIAELQGAGGGGGSSTNGSLGAGADGGDTSMATVIVGVGGAGGSGGGQGATVPGNSCINSGGAFSLTITTTPGSPVNNFIGAISVGFSGMAANGANSLFGWGGVGGCTSLSRPAETAGNGSVTAGYGAGGGGGGGIFGSTQNANGGGCGGYIKVMLPNPSGTYSLVVGGGGAGGTGGSNAGGDGGSGYIQIVAYFL